MLGEFASLKSKHDGGIAEANQQNLLNVIANEVKQSLKATQNVIANKVKQSLKATQNVIANKVKQSFLHYHCEPKARQSFQLHNNRLPRRYAPRNDDNISHNHSMLWVGIRLFFDVILDFWRQPIRRGSRTKMQIFKAELKSWMLGEFASLKSKHDSEVASARIKLSKTVQCGRSMIEMLGVLAIIGVLSVGGIAGYSKAMEKFKVNKLLDEYSMLLYGILGNVNEFKNQSQSNSRSLVGLVDYALATSLVPETWKKINNTRMTDSQGNVILLFSRSNRLVIDIYIGGVVNEKTGTMTYSIGYKADVCRELMQNFVHPLHSVVQFMSFFRWTDGEYANLYRGDNYCNNGEKCLRDIILTEINTLCKSCEGDKEACCINMEF